MMRAGGKNKNKAKAVSAYPSPYAGLIWFRNGEKNLKNVGKGSYSETDPVWND